MYLDPKLGLVTDDQGNQKLYIPWKQVRIALKNMEMGKPFDLCSPMHPLTREQAAFILQNADYIRRSK